MSGTEYFDQETGGEYFDASQTGGEYYEAQPEYYDAPPEEFDASPEEFDAPPEEFDAPPEEFDDEEFDASPEEWSNTPGDEEFRRHRKGKGKGKRRSLGQYLRMLVRYLIEAAVLVAVLYLLTPAENRGSLKDLAMMAVTFAAILILLDMFGGMGLAARLGAGLGVGFRMAGVASVL